MNSVERLQKIQELLEAKKEKMTVDKAKEDAAKTKYNDKARVKALTTTERLARIEELLGLD